MKRKRKNVVGSNAKIVRRLIRIAVIIFSILFVLQIAFACVPVPEWFNDWLACTEIEPADQPRYVVLLGGSIPSESGLIRAYYAAEFSRGRRGMTQIISMPADDDPLESGPGKVRDELILRGIDPSDILFESNAKNTYEEAVAIREMLGEEALSESVLLVTSPSHMRRSLLCFLKQGFKDLTCLPAENIYYEVDIGSGGFFRYTFWYRLAAQPGIVRELVALGIYKLKGWI